MEDWVTGNLDHIAALRKQISDQLLESPESIDIEWVRKTLRVLFSPAADRFASLAASFDAAVQELGFTEAARMFMPRFLPNTDISGVDAIPREGPLLIASNHPGTFDSLLIAASLPRSDLKIVAADYPFLQNLPTVRNHLIFVPKNDPHGRMSVIRSALNQLQQGGSLLIFPRGIIEPDPAVMKGAEESIELWSPSLEIFLRRVPETKVIISMISGLLTKGTVRNPLMKLWRNRKDRQTVMEVLQVIRHMFLPNTLTLHPRISFSLPFTIEDLVGKESTQPSLTQIIQSAQQMLGDHIGHIVDTGEASNES